MGSISVSKAHLMSLLCLFGVLLCSVSAKPQTNPGSNCFKSLASVKNGPRQEHGVAAIGKDIYVIAGTTMANGVRGQTNTAEVYNIDSNSWSNITSLPEAVHHLNVAAVNGKVYVLGALNGFAPARKTLGNVWRYDPGTKKWDELGQMPAGQARGSCAVAVKGEKIYLAGGLQPEMGDLDFGKNVADIVSTYDTVTGKWSTLPKLPEKRDHVGGAYVGDTFYVVGGRTGSVPSVKNTTWALKEGATEWKVLASMPTARGGLSTAVIGSKIYTFGGEGNPTWGSNQVFPDVESYDTTTDRWAKEASMKVPRHGTQAVTVDNVIYIPGGGLQGGGGRPVATVEAYGSISC
jgi:N-acetylneuraminic acid mutarotase